MDAAHRLIDLSPIAWLLLIGALLAGGPVWWVWRRSARDARPGERRYRMLRALTVFTLFLTFDLVVFGAFTRLTDSGLGCPDWPGCYGTANPMAAHSEIRAAEQAQPTGPVTLSKAWIEMIHRYLASAVGALLIVQLVLQWLEARDRTGAADRASTPGIRPGLAALLLLWVCVQGAFGALTVTLKLYPAIVTLHLLLGIGLLALLALQAQAFRPDPPVAWPTGLRLAFACFLLLVLVQIALGGWVSTNYAVLACRDFPTCQGQWWPPMHFDEAFEWRRPLGRSSEGGYLPFEALTAIHITHRLMAGVVLLAGLALGLAFLRRARAAAAAGVPDGLARRVGLGVLLWLLWQVGSGLSNVILGWPLLAALAHTAGAAAVMAAGVAVLGMTRSQPSALSQPGRIRHDAHAPGSTHA